VEGELVPHRGGELRIVSLFLVQVQELSIVPAGGVMKLVACLSSSSSVYNLQDQRCSSLNHPHRREGLAHLSSSWRR
jgi:hypothetical protein